MFAPDSQVHTCPLIGWKKMGSTGLDGVYAIKPSSYGSSRARQGLIGIHRGKNVLFGDHVQVFLQGSLNNHATNMLR